jgi:hypothetical protein
MITLCGCIGKISRCDADEVDLERRVFDQVLLGEHHQVTNGLVDAM